jgi:ubiquinone biosynthesis protein
MGTYHADPHAGNLFAMPDGRVGFVDFGRVGVISRQHRSAVFNLLIAVIDDDPMDATDALLSMAGPDPRLNVGELQADLERVTTLYRESQHRRDVLRATLLETLKTVSKHHVDLSNDIVQLVTTLSVLEGVASEIHPGFSMIEAAQPFAKHLLIKSFGPDAFRDESLHALRRYRTLLEELPVSLTRMLRRAASGEFQVGVRPEGYRNVLGSLHEMVDRLALSVLVAAFVLAFSYMTAQGGLADWIRWIAGGVLSLSAVMAIWLLGSIIVATWRRRRH